MSCSIDTYGRRGLDGPVACARGVAISPLGKCWGNRCQPPFGPNCVCTQAIHHDPSTGSCSAGCAGHDGVIRDGGYWGARCKNECPRGPLVQAGLDATAFFISFFYFFFLFLFVCFFCFSFGDAQTTPNSSSIAAVSEDSGTHFPGRIGTIQGSNPKNIDPTRSEPCRWAQMGWVCRYWRRRRVPPER